MQHHAPMPVIKRFHRLPKCLQVFAFVPDFFCESMSTM